MASVPYDASPTVKADVQAPNDAQRIDANPNEFGAQIATGASQFGAGLTKASQFWGSVQTDDALNNAQKAMGDATESFKNLRGGDALAAQDGVKKSLDEIQQQYRGQLTTPEQQLQFDSTIRPFRDRYIGGQIATHAEQQGYAFAAKTNGDALSQAFEMAATAGSSGDAGHIEVAKERARTAAIKQIQLDGQESNADAVKQAISKADAGAYKSAAEAMAVKNPLGAQKFIEAHKDDLGVAYAPLADQISARADKAQGLGLNDEASKAATKGWTPRNGDIQNVSAHGAAPAEGASGYGLINAPYRAPLDQKGEKGILSPADHFTYLKSIGASNNEALMLTGAAGSESSFNATAVHDNGNGYGLYGHNVHRLNLTGQNWQQQASAALQELRQRPEGQLVNAATTPEQLAVAEMHYEQPRGYTSANPKGGDNFSGRLNTIRYFSQMANGTLSGAAGAPVAGRSPPEGVGAGPSSMQGLTPGLPAGVLAPSAPATEAPPIENAAFTPPAAPQAQQGPPQSPDDLLARKIQYIEQSDADPRVKAEAAQAAQQEYRLAAIAAEQNAKAVKDRQDAVVNEYDGMALQGNYTQAFAQLRNDTRIPAEKRLAIEEMLEKRSGNSNPVSYGPKYMDYFNRVLARSGDPSRISDITDLYRAEAAGEITSKATEHLKTVMKDIQKEGGGYGEQTLVKNSMDHARDMLAFETDTGFGTKQRNVEGQARFDTDFSNAFLNSFDAWKKEGKDPYQFPLFQRKNLDQMIEQIYPKSQRDAAKISDQGGEVAATAQTIPPPPPDADPVAWNGLMAARPVAANGTAWAPANWAAAVTDLRSSPTKEKVQAWDRKFGPVGLDADFVLGRLEKKSDTTPNREAEPPSQPAQVFGEPPEAPQVPVKAAAPATFGMPPLDGDQ